MRYRQVASPLSHEPYKGYRFRVPLFSLEMLPVLSTKTTLRLATHKAEDFKQGAKIAKASVSQGGYVGTLFKIPLC
jgi:hypothetical protein